MRVARKHIIAAVEDAGGLRIFRKHAIKAVGESGWTISVLPRGGNKCQR